jgi:hypothetical protein
VYGQRYSTVTSQIFGYFLNNPSTINMPDMASVEKFLASLESDSSKVLGITVGSKVVTPGLFIPKAGTEYAFLSSVPIPSKSTFGGANATNVYHRSYS